MNMDDLPARLAAHAALLAAISRCGSFSAAAERLGLVQSAVSQRVKTLETRLGSPLFVRTTRTLSKTPIGEIVCAAAERSVEEWTAVAERVHAARDPAVLGITLSSALALKWAIPALPRITAEAGEIVLRVGEDLAPLDGPEAGVALRFGRGPYPGLHAEALCRCDLVPVASPRLDIAGGLDALVAQGSGHLLHDRRGARDGTGVSWAAYAAARGIAWPGAGSGGHYDRSDLALQAAIGGMGIALGRTLLVEGDIGAGLLSVVGPAAACGARYWIVTTPAVAATERYRALRAALLTEVARTQGTGAVGASRRRGR